MKRHEDCKILPYTPEQIYAMVADIEAYPEFLPWCRAARIRQSHTQEQVTNLQADLVIAFSAFREKFGSDVRLDPNALQIDVNYLDGPFRKLVNQWKFSPVPEGTKVEFFVEFEFKSKILQIAIGQVFDQAMRRIVHAFEERAKLLYG